MSLQPKNKVSIKQKVGLIVALYVFVTFVVLCLSYLQSNVMNSVRAYVRAEGIWAKAQKDAVSNLKDYARSKDFRFYTLYEQALLVPLGDKLARKSLQLETPDLTKAFAGFAAGNNHEEDINSMIYFFLWFKNFPYMNEAINIWTIADHEIEYLQQVSQKIQHAVTQKNERDIESLQLQLDLIDKKLLKLEIDFSSTLSEGARWVKQLLLIVSAMLFSLMLIISLFISRRIILSIEKMEKELLISNNRFDSLYKYDMLGIVVWHIDGRLLDANESFLAMTGFEHSDFEGGKLNWREMTPPEHQKSDEKALEEIARQGFCVPFEKEFFCKDGSRVPVILGAALLEGESNKGIAYIIDQRDRKTAETKLRLSAIVFDSTNNGILITDNNFQVISINKVYTELTGHTQATVLGNEAHILSSDSLNEKQLAQMSLALEKEGCWKQNTLKRNEATKQCQ